MNNSYIKQFTALRGISALWLALFHYSWYTNIGSKVDLGIFRSFVKHGYLGVDIFYFLSGYVLCHVYGKQFYYNKESFSNLYLVYLKNRLARIYPVYIFTLLLILALYATNNLTSFVLDFGSFSFKNFIYSILLIQSWGINTDWAWNMPSWTVSIEWLLYLLFPLFIKLLYKRDIFYKIIICAGLYCALITFINLYPKLLLYDAMRYGFLRAIPEFAIGIIFCTFEFNVENIRFSNTCFILASILLYVAINLHTHPGTWIGLLSCIVFLTPHTKGFIRRFLNSKPIQHLGEISYSLYLSQFFLQIISNKVFPAPIKYSNNFNGLLSLFIEISCLILFSYLVHITIEKPIRDKLKQPLPYNFHYGRL